MVASQIPRTTSSRGGGSSLGKIADVTEQNSQAAGRFRSLGPAVKPAPGAAAPLWRLRLRPAAVGLVAMGLVVLAWVGELPRGNAARPTPEASAPATFAFRWAAAPAGRPSFAASQQPPAVRAGQSPAASAAPQSAQAPPPGGSTPGPPANSKARLGLREGAWLVDQVGYFRTVGDRWVFVIEPAGPSLVALENRNLERIARAVAGYPRRLRWKVTASVTEFQGNHFILVETAVVKSEEREPEQSEPSHPARGMGEEKTRQQESPVGPKEGKLGNRLEVPPRNGSPY